MDEAVIKSIVAAVLAEQKKPHVGELDDVVIKTIATMLTSFGIEEDDRVELRADFMHLRKWRKSVEQAQSVTFKMTLTTMIGGVIGAVWLGLKEFISK